MEGKRFGWLTVLSFVDMQGAQRRYLCQCDCGKEHLATGNNLRRGSVQSCGCMARKHGYSTGPQEGTYNTWRSMIARCCDPRISNYDNYGGRGVTVCAEWLSSIDAFVSDMGDRPQGRTLDRIDADGNYEKSNCRWATPSEQAQNRRPRTRA